MNKKEMTRHDFFRMLRYFIRGAQAAARDRDMFLKKTYREDVRTCLRIMWLGELLRLDQEEYLECLIIGK